MPGVPQIRAAFCRSELGSLDAVDADLGQRVREVMNPDALMRIQTASRLAWLPVELDVELTRALFAVAGPVRAQKVLRDSMVAEFDGPMLRPLRAAAAALFGNTVKDASAWAPRVWSVIFRDAGELAVVDAGTNAVDFVLRDLPRVVLESPNYLLGFSAVFEAVFVIHGAKGSMFLTDPDPRTGEVRLKARW